jgi:hypothetical protein
MKLWFKPQYHQNNKNLKITKTKMADRKAQVVQYLSSTPINTKKIIIIKDSMMDNVLMETIQKRQKSLKNQASGPRQQFKSTHTHTHTHRAKKHW